MLFAGMEHRKGRDPICREVQERDPATSEDPRWARRGGVPGGINCRPGEGQARDRQGTGRVRPGQARPAKGQAGSGRARREGWTQRLCQSSHSSPSKSSRRCDTSLLRLGCPRTHSRHFPGARVPCPGCAVGYLQRIGMDSRPAVVANCPHGQKREAYHWRNACVMQIRGSDSVLIVVERSGMHACMCMLNPIGAPADSQRSRRCWTTGIFPAPLRSMSILRVPCRGGMAEGTIPQSVRESRADARAVDGSSRH
jgi:hypothetical protein